MSRLDALGDAPLAGRHCRWLSRTLNLDVEGGDRPAVILRDGQVPPALRAIVEDGLLRYLDQARQSLTEPLGQLAVGRAPP